jgi:hypothetical protein
LFAAISSAVSGRPMSRPPRAFDVAPPASEGAGGNVASMEALSANRDLNEIVAELATEVDRLTDFAGKVHEVVPPLPPGELSLLAKKHIPMAIVYDFDGTSAHVI